jgi:tetratricopeptide (TPR) repeat protein
VATTILATYPNPWLEELCAINAFCIEFCRGDYGAAEKHLNEAAVLADATGALRDTVSNNLGHLYLQTGEFEKAERILAPLADRASGQVLESALDGLARVLLATGRLTDCERVLEQLAAKAVDGIRGFPLRSNLLTRTRLLLRQRRWADAQNTADSAIAEASNVADRYLLGTALFLRALATAMSGDLTTIVKN